MRESKGRPVVLIFGILLLGVVLSSIAIVTVSGQRSSSAAIDQLWQDSARQLLGRVVLRVTAIYESGAQAVTLSERSVENGTLRTDDRVALLNHLESQLDAFPSIVWASFATPDGTYVSVYRWPVGDDWEVRRTVRTLEADGRSTRFFEERRDGETWTEIRNEVSAPYDPREKPWYADAVKRNQGEGAWNPPLLFHSRKQLGLHYSMPSFDPETGELRGVWTSEFEAAPVVAYLADLETSPGTKIYVLAEDGTIVSRPDGRVVGDDTLLDANTANDPLLLKTWEAIRSDGVEPKQTFEVGDRLAMFANMQDETGLPWLVVVTVPKSTLFADAREFGNFALVMGFLGVLLSLLLTLGAAAMLRRIVRESVESAIAESKVGQYTLEYKLGEGGMGEVYFARHAMMRRPTAVKLLRPNFNAPIDIERFEKEVQMTCRLTHPNTVTIFDYGHTPDGRFFYAMEFIDGVTLKDFVQFTGAISAGRAIFLIEQLCAALAEAHSIGLVHRDVKPANILIAEIGGVGDFLKIVDFGLVKNVADPDADVTQDGSFSGTPGFLAPEVPVSSGVVTPVTDVYSVGAVLYVLLTCHAPFEAESAMAIFIDQQTKDPVRPSVRKPELNIPPDLDTLVMECMSRDPAVRPSSAGELRRRLLECADCGTWTEEDANAWWTKHGHELLSGREMKETGETRTLLALTRRMSYGSDTVEQ